MAKKKDYEVGYGKPPKEHQFKPNQSGNPKGRPKGSKNFRTDVKDTLNSKVPISGKGRTKKVSTQLAALMRLKEKALKGDARALEKLMELARTYNDEDIAETAGGPLIKSDDDILKNYLERQNRRDAETGEAEEPTNDTGSPDGADASETPDTPVEHDIPVEDDDDEAWLH